LLFNLSILWWADGDKNENWCISIPRGQEFVDHWGYQKGELKLKVDALIPRLPSIITVKEITQQLSAGDPEKLLAFRKAIRRILNQMEKTGHISSRLIGYAT
jgi:hypothetical protein